MGWGALIRQYGGLEIYRSVSVFASLPRCKQLVDRLIHTDVSEQEVFHHWKTAQHFSPTSGFLHSSFYSYFFLSWLSICASDFFFLLSTFHILTSPRFNPDRFPFCFAVFDWITWRSFSRCNLDRCGYSLASSLSLFVGSGSGRQT